MSHNENSCLRWERIGSVLRITLNRPERHNALSDELIGELHEAISAVRRDRDIRVVVLRGAGPSFCSGFDFAPESAEEQPAGPVELFGKVRDSKQVFERWWDCPVPTIAQVHGNCLAAGTDLALCSDLILCATDARIGYPAVRSMGVPGSHMWLYHLGPQWTKRLLLTGDSLTGARAAELGLALEAVPESELDSHALLLANRMALISRDLLIANKNVVNRGLDLMGRALLQDAAATLETLGRLTQEADSFWRTVERNGVRRAVAERDTPFTAGDPIS